MSSKQDRTYTRTASDLEQKYNFGQTFAVVYGLINDVQTAVEETKKEYEGLDAEEIFNRLTNYGKNQAIFRDDTGNIYINATYIKSGKLAADYIAVEDIKIKGAQITGELDANVVNAMKFSASQITSGKLAAAYIDATNLEVSAANITGALSATNVNISGLLSVNYGYSAYGYIGASTASTTIGTGVTVCDTTMSNGVLAMTTGAKMIAGGTNNQIYIVSGGAGIVAGGIYYRFMPTAFYPSSSVTLGTSSALWGQIFSTNSTISTSDREKKNSIVYDMDERYDTLWSLLKPCTGKYNDGTSDRTHMFLISQDVEDAIEESGLTSQDFAAFIKSPKRDEDGNVLDGYDYALRYEEFIPLCIRQIQKLQMRVSELEGL